MPEFPGRRSGQEESLWSLQRPGLFLQPGRPRDVTQRSKTRQEGGRDPAGGTWGSASDLGATESSNGALGRQVLRKDHLHTYTPPLQTEGSKGRDQRITCWVISCQGHCLLWLQLNHNHFPAGNALCRHTPPSAPSSPPSFPPGQELLTLLISAGVNCHLKC